MDDLAARPQLHVLWQPAPADREAAAHVADVLEQIARAIRLGQYAGDDPACTWQLQHIQPLRFLPNTQVLVASQPLSEGTLLYMVQPWP